MFRPPSLKESGVHIWKIDLAETAWDCFTSVLSAEERMKATRIHIPCLQDLHRRCRTALRLLLSAYTGASAAGLVFECDALGKPELAKREWRFNVSHSKDKALIAISRHQVGIDLEYTETSSIEMEEISKLICHVHDNDAFAVMPEKRERDAHSYRLWVQKESYAKAVGIGLQCELTAIYFTALTASASRVCDERATSPALYFVHFMQPFPSYAASICVSIAEVCIDTFEARPEQFSTDAAASDR